MAIGILNMFQLETDAVIFWPKKAKAVSEVRFEAVGWKS